MVMNMGRSWRVSWVCGEGRVNRAGFYDESWDKSCRGVLPGHSPREVSVAGTCDRERSWGGVSLWDDALGWRCCLAWGTECPVERGIGSPLVKTSCLVTLRTDMFCGPGLRKPYAPLSLTMETGQMYDLLARCHYY
jgi:hypothetical protein